MRLLTFENIRTLTNSLSIGKEYLVKIINYYVKEDTKDILRELDYFILTIESDDTVDSFSLHEDLRELFNDEDTYSELAERLNRYLVLYDDFGYCFMFHARNVIREFDERTTGIRRRKSTIHNYFKFFPKQPKDKNNISDTNTNYNSIMSKMYLDKYQKYVDENDNGAGAWTFQLSGTYLIVIDKLYRLLQPYITDVKGFFFNCVVSLNPVITGFSYTTEITSRMNASEIIYELLQLTPAGSYIHIQKSKENNEVEFTFTSEKGTFTSSEKPQYKRKFRGDKHGNRNVQVHISSNGNRLFVKFEIVGLQFIGDITELPANRSLFSLNTDELALEVYSYEILSTILSHTKEFQSDLNFCKRRARKLVKTEKVPVIFCEKDTIKETTEGLLRDRVFKSLKHEKLIRTLLYLEKKYSLKRFNLDYYRYVVSGLNKTDSEISEMLKPLGPKQQARIRKIIKDAKSCNYTGIPALHYFFRELTYRIA